MRSLAAAAVAAVLLHPVAASAAPPTASRDVRLSGRAGDVATFRLDRAARIGHRGSGVTVVAPLAATWSGVAITRLDSPAASDGMDTYVHYRLHNPLLCPGEQCEPDAMFQPTVVTSNDGQGYAILRPGVYGVALLGPRGTAVSAAVHLVGPRKGRTTLRPVRAAAYETTLFDPAVATPGGELGSRGFARFATKGRHVVDSVAVGFALARPAAIQYAICATGGGRRALDGTGGATPCADGDGDDFLAGPNVHPAPVVEYGSKRTGIAWLVTSGRLREDTGLGYEAHVAGAGGRIAALHFAVAF